MLEQFEFAARRLSERGKNLQINVWHLEEVGRVKVQRLRSSLDERAGQGNKGLDKS